MSSVDITAYERKAQAEALEEVLKRFEESPSWRYTHEEIVRAYIEELKG